MIWSSISWSGVGWLCKIEGNMNSELYKIIVNDDLEKSIYDMCQKLKLRRNPRLSFNKTMILNTPLI